MIAYEIREWYVKRETVHSSECGLQVLLPNFIVLEGLQLWDLRRFGVAINVFELRRNVIHPVTEHISIKGDIKLLWRARIPSSELKGPIRTK